MTRPFKNADEFLEALIDAHGLIAVLDILATICGEKAAHVAEAWQDAHTAKRWSHTAAVLSDFIADRASDLTP